MICLCVTFQPSLGGSVTPGPCRPRLVSPRLLRASVDKDRDFEAGDIKRIKGFLSTHRGQASPPAAQKVPGRVKLIMRRNGPILRWKNLLCFCQVLIQGGGQSFLENNLSVWDVSSKKLRYFPPLLKPFHQFPRLLAK